jgi:hypothetical protein
MPLETCTVVAGTSSRITCGSATAEAIHNAYEALQNQLIARRQYGQLRIAKDEALGAELRKCADNRCYKGLYFDALDDIAAEVRAHDAPH